MYAMRNRIERFINRLKNSRRIATRYDHTSTSFLGFVLPRQHSHLDQICPRGPR
jgi:transposase